MNINELKQRFFEKARKNQIGFVGIDAFNREAEAAQFEMFEELVKFYERTRQLSDKLGDTIIVDDSDSGLSYDDVNGILTKPNNYHYFINIEGYTTVLDDCDNEISDWVPMDLKEQGKKNYILNSRIVYPDKHKPVAFIESRGFNIYPKGDVQKVRLTYFKKPAPPKWAFTGSPDNPTYDSGNSQGLELAESTHNDIIEIMLRNMIGQSQRDNTMYQTSENNQKNIV